MFKDWGQLILAYDPRTWSKQILFWTEAHEGSWPTEFVDHQSIRGDMGMQFMCKHTQKRTLTRKLTPKNIYKPCQEHFTSLCWFHRYRTQITRWCEDQLQPKANLLSWLLMHPERFLLSDPPYAPNHIQQRPKRKDLRIRGWTLLILLDSSSNLKRNLGIPDNVPTRLDMSAWTFSKPPCSQS